MQFMRYMTVTISAIALMYTTDLLAANAAEGEKPVGTTAVVANSLSNAAAGAPSPAADVASVSAAPTRGSKGGSSSFGANLRAGFSRSSASAGSGGAAATTADRPKVVASAGGSSLSHILAEIEGSREALAASAGAAAGSRGVRDRDTLLKAFKETFPTAEAVGKGRGNLLGIFGKAFYDDRTEIRLDRSSIQYIKMTCGAVDAADLLGVGTIKDDAGNVDYTAKNDAKKTFDSTFAPTVSDAEIARQYADDGGKRSAEFYGIFKETGEIGRGLSLLLYARDGYPLELSFAAFMYHLGMMGVTKDAERAVVCATRALPWLEAQTKAGNVYAACNLGWFYKLGLGVAADYSKTIDIWLPLDTPETLEKHPGLGYTLGWMYLEGNRYDKLSRTMSEAEHGKHMERVLLKAAESGSLPAQNMLVEVYGGGYKGIEVNDAKAAHWKEAYTKGKR